MNTIILAEADTETVVPGHHAFPQAAFSWDEADTETVVPGHHAFPQAAFSWDDSALS
jgi:hypothetical protein